MISTDEGLTIYDMVNNYGYKIEEITGAYPIWDETKRSWLDKCILNHFIFREIASETPVMFIHFFNRKMVEVMPKYNAMFEVMESDISPLQTSAEEFTSTSNTDTSNRGTNSSSSSSSTTAESTSRNLASTTPQTQLSGHEQYADSLQDATGKQTQTAESEDSGQSSSNGTENRSGSHSIQRTGAIMEQMDAWLEGANNILPLLFHELETLFNQLWR